VEETRAINRLEALHAALRKGRPKPDRWFAFLLPILRPSHGHAWIVSAITLGVDGEPEAVAEAVRQRYEALGDTLGGSATQGQWIEAAFAVRFGAKLARFGSRLSDRTLTRDQAFTLALLNVPASTPGDDVRAMYHAISAWRVNQSNGSGARLSVYAVAHVAQGRSVEAVLAAQDAAKTVFATDKIAKGSSDAGARACAAFDSEPRETLERFRVFLEAFKDDPHVRKIKLDTLMEWAAEGVDATDFATLRRVLAASSTLMGLNADSRVAVAYLIFKLADYTQTQPSEADKTLQAAAAATALAAGRAMDAARGGDGGDGGDCDRDGDSDGGGGGGGGD